MFYRLRRRLTKAVNEAFYRLGYKDLRRALDGLGLDKGSAVCVHSAVRELGHLADGPDGAVRALQDAVGKSGAVLMPTFTFGGAMRDYVGTGPAFDVRSTPSKVGFLTEYFRKQECVHRSLHPTHPVAGWGDKAMGFLEGHEDSKTPFGMRSPYGRLVEDTQSYMLMLGTPLLSLPHHLQERVDFPNLFLEGVRSIECLDWDGRRYVVETRVMRPKVPYFVAIPPPSGHEPAWCVLHDFCLQFPDWRERDVKRSGIRLDGQPSIISRRRDLEASGVLRTTKFGRGEIGLLNVAEFVRTVQPELESLLTRYSGHYTIENITAKNGL